MNPDTYNFTAECPQCKTTRGVSCSRAQVKTGQPVEIYAIACDHSWTLTPEQSQQLRDNSTAFS
jgi:hypothetical protein